MICFGDIATLVKKRVKTIFTLMGKQSVQPFVYNFGMLVDNGKKIVCVRSEFKSCCMEEDFTRNSDIIL